MFKYFQLLFVILFLSCQDEGLEVNLSKVDYNIDFRQFDKALIGIDTTNFEENTFPQLQREFAPFVSNGSFQYWKNIAVSADQIRLQKEIDKIFSDRNQLKTNTENTLKHFYYYFPNATPITVYTYNSAGDFNYPVIFADSLLFLALDNYLGKDHPIYGYLDNYLVQEKSKAYLQRDIALEISLKQLPQPQTDQPLLKDMVYWGKVWYTIKALNPSMNDSIISGFSADEIQFCLENERAIYSYFMSQNLLFDTSLDAKRRFIYKAPFSKFGTAMDQNSPGRIGQWVGYRIIQEAARNQNLKLPELLKTDYETLFKYAKYKPE